MQVIDKKCVVCHKTTDAEHLVPFGDDLVCSDCKDDYVQCLKEGVEPSFQAGAWQHGRVMLAEPKARLTERCLSCNQPATTTRPLRYVPRQSFKFTLKSPKPFELDAGFCEPCRRDLDRYAKIAGAATICIGVGWLGGILLAWINAPVIGEVCMALTAIGVVLWLIRLCLKPEPSAIFLDKPKLIRIKGTGKLLRSSFPEIPKSRLEQQVD